MFYNIKAKKEEEYSQQESMKEELLDESGRKLSLSKSEEKGARSFNQTP